MMDMMKGMMMVALVSKNTAEKKKVKSLSAEIGETLHVTRVEKVQKQFWSIQDEFEQRVTAGDIDNVEIHFTTDIDDKICIGDEIKVTVSYKTG